MFAKFCNDITNKFVNFLKPREFTCKSRACSMLVKEESSNQVSRTETWQTVGETSVGDSQRAMCIAFVSCIGAIFWYEAYFDTHFFSVTQASSYTILTRIMYGMLSLYLLMYPSKNFKASLEDFSLNLTRSLLYTQW